MKDFYKKWTNLTIIFWVISILSLFIIYFQNIILWFAISGNLSVKDFFTILAWLLGFFFWVYRYFDLLEIKKEKEDHFKYLRTLKETLSPDKLKVRFFDDINIAKELYDKEWDLRKAPLWFMLKINDLYEFKLEILSKLSEDDEFRKSIPVLKEETHSNDSIEDNSEEEISVDDLVKDFDKIIKNENFIKKSK